MLTELAAISECLPTLAALVWFLSAMAPLMPLEGRLSREEFSASWAFKTFIYMV
jgi:hypothetical protein